MASLIEQAAKRLEQLRESGVSVPEASAATRITDAFQPIHLVPEPPPWQPPAPSPVQAATPIEVEAATTMPAAPSRRIELNLAGLAKKNIVTPNRPRSPVAEQFRSIKRPLLANAIGRGAASIAHANLIMVTSALAGEGRSFTSINLAMSIAAELDIAVMLVDADVARPSLPKVLDLPDGPGLLDLLGHACELSDALLMTNVGKLSILGGGTAHERSAEMLASDAMRQWLDDMSRRSPDQVIIFDSPPLLPTAESRALAMNMGQIVVVVHAGKTLQSVVQQAVATIEACPLKMMLLNQARGNTRAASGHGQEQHEAA